MNQTNDPRWAIQVHVKGCVLHVCRITRAEVEKVAEEIRRTRMYGGFPARCSQVFPW